MESKFKDLYIKFMGESAVIEEADNANLQNYNGLPEPFTEVRFKSDALKNPYIANRDGAFKEKIKNYIAETDSKDKKYRLVVSAVHAIRNSMEFGGTGALGHTVDIIEQEGPVSKGFFTVPLEALEIKNAAWNAMQASIPDGWRYNRFKHVKFADMFDDYNKGQQPNGTVKTGGNN